MECMSWAIFALARISEPIKTAEVAPENFRGGVSDDAQDADPTHVASRLDGIWSHKQKKNEKPRPACPEEDDARL